MTAVADASRSQEPDAIKGIVQAIADWYNKDKNIEQSMRQTRSVTLRDGLWRYGELIVVPEDKSVRSRCIAINHEIPSAGHSGRDIIFDLVQKHFWWSTICQDVAKHVASCVSCQVHKSFSRKVAGQLQPLPIPDYPWQSMSMDLITHLPCTVRGYTAIIALWDRLTKIVHFTLGRDNMSAEDFANIFMVEIFRRHGLPETFFSDRGTIFKEFFAEVCKQPCIQQYMSTAFYPQTDGQTERANRTLEEMPRHYVSPSQDDWDLELPCAKFAVNNAVKVVKASSGFTPFFLNYG